MLSGRYPEAADQFEVARGLAGAVDVRANIEGKIGELAFKRGNNQASAEALESSLRSLGRSVPCSTPIFLLRLLWETAIQTLHTWLPGTFLGRREREGHDDEFVAIRLYCILQYAYFFDRGKIPCLRAINLAERYPPTPELGHAWSTHAPVMSLLPWLSRGEKFAKKSFDVRSELGDLWGQGQSLNYWGVLTSVGSRFDDCISKCSEAVRLLQRTGDYWDVHVGRWLIADAMYRKGELSSAVTAARRLYADASKMGDDKVSGFCIDTWARASGGLGLPEEVARRELQKDRHDVQASTQVLLGEAVRLVGQREYTSAVEVLNRAQQVCGAVGMENDWVAPVWPWKATALRLQFQSTNDGEERRRLLREARRAARQAVALGRKFKSDLSHALREAGLISLLSGGVRRARRFFEASLAEAERTYQEFEYAQTQLARGQAGQMLGWSGAADDIESARGALLEMGADFALNESGQATNEGETATLSLADRFETVLQSGREIASALTRDAIVTASCDAALRLLRGQHCHVLELGPDGHVESSARDNGVVCVQMVDRAVSSVGTVVYDDSNAADVSEELLLSGVRSALCTPILVRGRPEACLFVTHAGVSGLFGDDEQHLAEFISTIAGAALENAAGFAELQSLTETLEQRVQERTAALEASNIELQQFAYIASHDLQTPLRGIAGFAQFLKDDYQHKLDATGAQHIDRIITGAQRMQSLIQDLLAYSRVDSRSLPFQPTDLNSVFDDAVELLSAEIETVGGEVHRDRLPVVNGDKAQLSQLLQNMIGNALKYHGDAPPHIQVSAEQGDNSWTIAIRDNGIGISEKHYDRIFDIFRRLHTQEKYPGTGIGLAVCRRIVNRHGGRIWLDPDVGHGTTFYFSIPEQS